MLDKPKFFVEVFLAVLFVTDYSTVASSMETLGIAAPWNQANPVGLCYCAQQLPVEQAHYRSQLLVQREIWKVMKDHERVMDVRPRCTHAERTQAPLGRDSHNEEFRELRTAQSQ